MRAIAISTIAPANTMAAAASIPHHRCAILRDWSLCGSSVDWPLWAQPERLARTSAKAHARTLATRLPTRCLYPGPVIRTLKNVVDPTRTALGTWSGGRFMHFGEPLDEERLIALFRPDERVATVLKADVYGQGEADALLGRALAGLTRDSYCLVGAVGHDFYEGERDGPKGFPRFTDPALRGPEDYAGYLRMATERSLERIGADSFDVLLLHNPDRTGYSSEAVWDGMRALRDDGPPSPIG